MVCLRERERERAQNQDAQISRRQYLHGERKEYNYEASREPYQDRDKTTLYTSRYALLSDDIALLFETRSFRAIMLLLLTHELKRATLFQGITEGCG